MYCTCILTYTANIEIIIDDEHVGKNNIHSTYQLNHTVDLVQDTQGMKITPQRTPALRLLLSLAIIHFIFIFCEPTY